MEVHGRFWKAQNSGKQSESLHLCIQGLRFSLNLLFVICLVSVAALAAPNQFATQALADNPIGYWRFGEAPGSTVAADSSGHGNNGRYSTTGITLGLPGFNGGDTAALFDGASGRVVVLNSTLLNPKQITMEAKIRWDGRNGFQQRIFEKSFFAPDPDNPERGQAQAQYGLSIMDDGHVRVELRTGLGASTDPVCGSRNVVCANSTATVTVGVETQIAATYDGRVIRIYLNGVFDSQAAAGDRAGDIEPALPDPQKPPFDLGIGNQSVRNRPFKGLLDEAVLYDKALSAERLAAHYQSQFAAPPAIFQYAVKFVCGKSAGTVVAPGTYFTAINVHNPGDKTVTFRKKFAVALPGEKGGPISKFFDAKLRSDEAFEIDCPDISRLTQARADFLKGFAVIETPQELDIVAVYTAAGSTGQVETMEIERVPPRREAAEGKPDLVPVPDAQGNFCRRTDLRLTVTVKNQGSADAGASTTTVDFGSLGAASQPTPPIPAGGSVDVFFNIPPGCFHPDCGFKITVDSGGVVDESNEANNTAVGSCPG
jgi:hypothetical protein